VLFEREKAMIWANTVNGSSSGDFHDYPVRLRDGFSEDDQNTAHSEFLMPICQAAKGEQ
jgi:hypothetical protein